MSAMISIRDMLVTYDDFAALDHVSLDVEEGESFGIVGESDKRTSTETGCKPLHAGLPKGNPVTPKKRDGFVSRVKSLKSRSVSRANPRTVED